jgi:(2Fe-2S) ferredoxin
MYCMLHVIQEGELYKHVNKRKIEKVNLLRYEVYSSDVWYQIVEL